VNTLADTVWRKSTRSAANGCVEVAFLDGQVALRDSKNEVGPVLLFTSTEWEEFISGAYEGEFDFG
jgi:hypothetical protein